MAGYYNNNNNPLCATCQYTCKTCSSSTSCLTCDEGNNRDPNLAATGFCACKNGYYDDSTPACKPCLYPCFTCTGPLSCKTCSALAHRTIVTADNTCPCNDGYFDSATSTQLCSTCDYSCKTCSSSATNCTSCSSSNYRSLLAGPSGTNSCPCNQYYFDKPTSNPICEKCEFSCSSCIDSTQCTSCNATKFRVLGAAYCDCLPGFYNVNV